MLTTLLVANRGEIALRVIRSARAAGLRTVAVYSDADAGAPHVAAADTAERLGPAPAEQSYLNIDAILDAARRSGADAVHPGYGFLSENADFARACTDAGLVFVGPPADVVDLMGSKDAARHAALAAGVPVVPAVEDTGDDATLAERALAELALPLLVKAAAGGGGKGMRVVRDAADLPAAIAAARRVARAAFASETLLVERFAERGRHVEVQVLADTHGSVLHLGERDCSVQRRYQKVVEEAPAPTVSAELRHLVTTSAVNLAREVGYVGAGTVEFLVAGDEAYFLEMNTRLQVEHPVTEAITGLDLVALQLAVAQGERLELRQEDVTFTGHAMEARVYAEDPDHGFLPQAGRPTTVMWPDGVRVDAGLADGQEVSTFYDPLLAKIVVHAATRETARQALVDALDASAVVGVTTNLGFLRRLVSSGAFADAEIDTAWLDRTDHPFPRGDGEVSFVAAAWLLAARPGRLTDELAGNTEAAGQDVAVTTRHPFATGDGWRLAGPPAPVLIELADDREVRVAYVNRAAGTVTVEGKTHKIRDVGTRTGGKRLAIDGTPHQVLIRPSGRGYAVVHQGQTRVYTKPDRVAADRAAASDGQVIAPMPGTVTAVLVSTGDEVTAGQALGVLEAMKMETTLAAPHAGTVTQVTATRGGQVSLGQILFTVEEA